MRDSQKTRMYDAEDNLPGRWENQFGTNEKTQAWVNEVTGGRWFRSRWRIPHITVSSGRNMNGRSFGGHITISPAGRNPVVVLHEIAHEVILFDTPGGPYPAHGREFCAVYLYLVGQFIGADAAKRLREGYRANKVRHRADDGIVPRTPRYKVPTEAQKRATKRTADATPPNPREVATAAATLRTLIKQGTFGPSGGKTRQQALTVARALEQQAANTGPASR